MSGLSTVSVPGWMGKARLAGKYLGPVGAVLGGGFDYADGKAQGEDDIRAGVGAAGSTAGGVAGGVLGSALGPLGTIAGGVVGSTVGGWVGDRVDELMRGNAGVKGQSEGQQMLDKFMNDKDNEEIAKQIAADPNSDPKEIEQRVRHYKKLERDNAAQRLNQAMNSGVFKDGGWASYKEAMGGSGMQQPLQSMADQMQQLSARRQQDLNQNQGQNYYDQFMR